MRSFGLPIWPLPRDRDDRDGGQRSRTVGSLMAERLAEEEVVRLFLVKFRRSLGMRTTIRATTTLTILPGAQLATSCLQDAPLPDGGSFCFSNAVVWSDHDGPDPNPPKCASPTGIRGLDVADEDGWGGVRGVR